MANWFIKVGVTEQGPFLDAQLRKLALNGQLRSSMQVRREGSDRLVEAGLIKGLFPPVPPPPLPPTAPTVTQITEHLLPSTKDIKAPSAPSSPHVNPRLACCPDCGRTISKSAISCPNCGRLTSTRNRMTALLLAWTIGGIGAHKFYLGRPSEGLIYLLFCWTFLPAIVALFDGFSYLGMSDQKFAEHFSSLNETRSATNRDAMTAEGALRWIVGGGMLMTALALLAEPGGWVGAAILSSVALCVIPPTWTWMCGTQVAHRFGHHISFWGLTIFGGLVTLCAIVGLATSASDRAAMPFFALFGLSLLPSIWKWLGRQFQKPNEFFTTSRWCLGLSGLLMAGFMLPSRGPATKTHEVRITREEYGDAWPFTVNEGVLVGEKFGASVEVTFAAGGSTYYLNGIAQQSGKYANLHEIWANNGELKKSVDPIIGRGVKLASGIDEPFVKKVFAGPSPSKSPIRCDSFDLSTAFENAPSATRGMLRIELDTDLPNSTEVTVAVSRGYINMADGEEYVIDYFTEQSTVGAWRRSRTIALDHVNWARKLEKSRASFAAAGEGFRVNGVNDYIDVCAIVPMPHVRSLNIVGRKVDRRSGIVVDDERMSWSGKPK